MLKIAVKLLSHDSKVLRSAACQCLRSLSRSVKNLRTHLVDVNMIDPIIRLLDSKEDALVRSAACATLCNMVLDFSSLKAAALEKNALDHILDMVRSMDNGLRLNAIWAFKNLIYLADSKLKAAVMAKMTYELLHDLIGDSDTEIQIQALNMLRNLACGEERDIVQVLQGLGTTRLLGLVQSKLGSPRKEIILQVHWPHGWLTPHVLEPVCGCECGHRRHASQGSRHEQPAAFGKNPTLHCKAGCSAQAHVW